MNTGDYGDTEMELPEQIREDLEKRGGFEGLAKSIPPHEELVEKSKTYHALSDPLRLTILYLIKDQPLCVCVIKRFTNLAGSKLSYHLNILKESGLVVGEYHGNWIIYSITDQGSRALMCTERIRTERVEKTFVTFSYGLIVACLIAIFIVTAGCADSSPHPSANPAVQPAKISNSTIGRVEVIHFHGDQQCVTCIAVGDLAEETVNEYFPLELSSGKVSFHHINFDDPANRDIISSYGITGSSLWITSYDANGVHRLQDLDVWSLTDDKERYKAYLAGVITRRLNGDLS